MKKNKILAGLSALVMGATMMASTAMSASAITAYDTSGAACCDTGFQVSYQDVDGDGDVDWADLQDAPGGMYDAVIKNAICNNGAMTLELQLAEITYHNITARGYISDIHYVGGTNLITSSGASIDGDTAVGTTTGYVTVNGNTQIELTVTFVFGNVTYNHNFTIANVKCSC